MSPSILIVGAGATGLTAAVELARHGILADVIERRDGPSKLSRAVGILPHSMELLAPSGAAARLKQEAIAVAHVAIYDEASLVTRLPLDLLEDENARLFALPQDRTEAILCDIFENFGGTVGYGRELASLELTSSGTRVEIDGATSEYDYVLGCDGTKSRVRTALGLSYEGFDLPETWSIADAEVENWIGGEDFCIFRLKDRKVCIAVPIGPCRYRFISNTPNVLDTLPVQVSVSNLRRESAFTIAVRQAPDYGKGNVYLAGDAAHCHSPAGGRGMNLGIADAAEWVERFTEGTLAGYSASRHEAGQDVIRFTERARKTVLSDGPIESALFFLAVRAVARVPALNRAALRRLLDV